MGAEVQGVMASAAVQKMQQRAAELRRELNGPTGHFKPGALTLEIPDTDQPSSSPAHAPTPAQPRFKPTRSYVTQTPPDDPFTPLAKPEIKSRFFSALSGASSSQKSEGQPSTKSALARRKSAVSEKEAPASAHSAKPQASDNPTLTSSRSVSPKRDESNKQAGPRSPVRMSLAAQEAHASLLGQVASLETQLENKQRLMAQMEEESRRRQDSYMRREDTLQTQIRKLEAELAQAQGQRSAAQDAKFGKASETIQTLHGQVVTEIEALLAKQAISIKHEEQTQTRRLKNKLTEMEAELLAERGATGRGVNEWMERTQALRTELETVQEIATKLDSMCKLSEEECRRLRAQFKCQEDDREYLVRQVVNLKSENKRLAVELAAMAAEASQAVQERDEALRTLSDHTQQGSDAGMTGDQGGFRSAGVATTSGSVIPHIDKDVVQVKIQRYEDVIDSLKRLCEAERKRTRQARAAHLAELSVRTELHSALRECLDDVRQRSALVKSATPTSATNTQQDSATGAQGHAHAGSAAPRRPFSAMPTAGAPRPGSAFHGRSSAPPRPGRPVSAMLQRTSNGGLTAAGLHGPFGQQGRDQGLGRSTSVTQACVLDQEERDSLIRELSKREDLLLSLLKTFPAAPPTLPGDAARLEAWAAARDARDAQVVANGRALAVSQRAQASGTKGLGGVGGIVDGGGDTERVAAGKPWVFNVDTMLSEFLS